MGWKIRSRGGLLIMTEHLDRLSVMDTPSDGDSCRSDFCGKTTVPSVILLPARVFPTSFRSRVDQGHSCKAVLQRREEKQETRKKRLPHTHPPRINTSHDGFGSIEETFSLLSLLLRITALGSPLPHRSQSPETAGSMMP